MAHFFSIGGINMEVIRQYALGGPEVLVKEQAVIPTIGQGEVLIRGYYTTVNYADIKTRTGAKGDATFPFTLGLDIVGEIVESNSERFSKGQRVIAFPKNGSYSQYVVASEALTYVIPNDLDLKQAAAMPTVSILSYILLHKIGCVQQSDTIVVHSAAGGVGSTIIQLAKLFGVQRIIGTTGDKGKFDFIKDLGAHNVYTYDDFAEKTLEITASNGANAIFDSVAGEVTERSMTCLAHYGTLVQFGNSSGRPGRFSTADVHNSCRNVKGFSLGTTRKLKPKYLQPVVDELLSMMTNGQIIIPIDTIYTLDEVAAAHQRIESRQHQGKILIKL